MTGLFIFSLVLSLYIVNPVLGSMGSLPPAVAKVYRYCAAVVIPGYEFLNNKEIPWFCSAGIVSRSHVITSAICVQNVPIAEITVVPSLESPWLSLDQDLYHVTDVRVEKVERKMYSFGIAVVKLHRQLVFSPFQMPLGIPTSKEVKKNAYIWGKMIGIGYGVNDAGKQGFNQHITALRVVALDYMKYCDDLYYDLRDFHNYKERFQCIGYLEAETTSKILMKMSLNDVGGPIVGEKNMKLYGIIASWKPPRGSIPRDVFPTVAISLQEEGVRNLTLEFMKSLGEAVV